MFGSFLVSLAKQMPIFDAKGEECPFLLRFIEFNFFRYIVVKNSGYFDFSTAVALESVDHFLKYCKKDCIKLSLSDHETTFVFNCVNICIIFDINF